MVLMLGRRAQRRRWYEGADLESPVQAAQKPLRPNTQSAAANTTKAQAATHSR